MRCLLLSLVLVVGCGSLQESYVEADAQTYEFAAPKLKTWAENTGDEDWVKIVNDKLIGWDARIKKAQKKIAEED